MLLCPWNSPGKILEWVAVPSSRDLPNPGIEPWSPSLQADSLLSEPPGKTLNPQSESESESDVVSDSLLPHGL